MANRCASCKKDLDEQVLPVPLWVRVPASVALAFVHGGMWAEEELSRAYCPRCRRLAAGLALALTAVILTAAAVGTAIWLRGPNG